MMGFNHIDVSRHIVVDGCVAVHEVQLRVTVVPSYHTRPLHYQAAHCGVAELNRVLRGGEGHSYKERGREGRSVNLLLWYACHCTICP